MGYRTRDGFTLIESIIAVVLLSVGLVALASTAAWTTRMVAAGSRSTRGGAVAVARLETLVGRACGTGQSSGDSAAGEFLVEWRTSVENHRAEISVVLKSWGPRGVSIDSFVSGAVCLP